MRYSFEFNIVTGFLIFKFFSSENLLCNIHNTTPYPYTIFHYMLFFIVEIFYAAGWAEYTVLFLTIVARRWWGWGKWLLISVVIVKKRGDIIHEVKKKTKKIKNWLGLKSYRQILETGLFLAHFLSNSDWISYWIEVLISLV